MGSARGTHSGNEEGGCSARQATERQEREAVRRAEEARDVEAACGADRELAGLVEPRREEVRLELVLVAFQLAAGRDDGSEEGCRPQGRQGNRAQEVTTQRAELSAPPANGPRYICADQRVKEVLYGVRVNLREGPDFSQRPLLFPV